MNYLEAAVQKGHVPADRREHGRRCIRSSGPELHEVRAVWPDRTNGGAAIKRDPATVGGPADAAAQASPIGQARRIRSVRIDHH